MSKLTVSKSWMKRALSISLLFVLSSAYMFAQQVTGTVKDSFGDPLIGVNIIEKGTTNGTTTKADGSFSIKVGKSKTLVFSYIGFITKTVQVKGNKLNVVLSDDSKSLDDVVVIGYGSMQRKNVTSSIISVTSEDLNIGGSVIDATQMLQGKVPGLTITNTSDPNGSSSVSLRGASSLREGTAMEPYYVIDGIPGVSMDLVSPEDIESIDVLRDATATAIYGSKAANGVIIVTTKKGKKDGHTSVSYSGYVAVDNTMKTLDMLTGDQLLGVAKRMGQDLSPYYNGTNANTDWQKEVLRSALSHNHNVSISGGQGKTSFNASVNYLDKQGVVLGSNMNHLTARSFVQTSFFKDYIDLSLSLNAGVKNNHSGATAGGNSSVGGKAVLDAMYYYTPLVSPYNADGSYFGNLSVSQNYNPLSMANEDRYNTNEKLLQGAAKLTGHITKDLALNVNLSYQNQQYIYNNYNSTQSQIYASDHGRATRSTVGNINKQMEIYGNYGHTWADIHKFDAMLGYSWEQQDNNDGFGLTAYNFYDDALQYYNMGLANKLDMTGIITNQLSTLRMISFYGRVNYAFDDRYLFQATVRRDGSSAFGKNNRWGTFPSASLAWRITNEKFMENQKIFDDLKFRVGYGVSGNSLGFDAYTALATYGWTGGFFPYTDADGVTQDYKELAATKNENPDLKWERTGMFNIGLDFQVLGGRLAGSIEYYDKRTKDLIYGYPVSTNRYAYSTLYANVGEISNRGIEFSLTGQIIKTRDLNWTSTLNISHNSNKVEKLSNATFSVDYIDNANTDIGGVTNANVQRIMEGSPIGQFYLVEWAGYNENGQSIFNDYDDDGNLVGTTTSPEDNDRRKAGSAQPKIVYSWNNSLSWKNWSLTAFFQGTIGNKIFNAKRAYYSNLTNIRNGKNGLAEIANWSDTELKDGYSQYPSDRYLENGSYLRLSTLTLGYNFGNFGSYIKNLKVYATCNNVFTITGYKGTDPEVSLGGLTPGIDYRQSTYPRTRTFLLGVNLNF